MREIGNLGAATNWRGGPIEGTDPSLVDWRQWKSNAGPVLLDTSNFQEAEIYIIFYEISSFLNVEK